MFHGRGVGHGRFGRLATWLHRILRIDPERITMEQELLRVEETRKGSKVVVALVGELDLSTTPLLIDRLARMVEDHPSSIDLDLSKLSYIDSTGLSVFVTAHYQCIDAGITLHFVDPNAFIDRVLAATGLSEVLTISKRGVLVEA
jgi:anti-anti-sigma factor